MTDTELLEEVKNRLGITGPYVNPQISGHIEDTKFYMEDAGVPKEILNDEVSVGAITRGVSDLWNYGAGNGTFSEFFYQRVAQLRLHEVEPIQPFDELILTSVPGDEILTTKITVQGASENPIFRYYFTDEIPSPGAVLSDWASWDGVSDIVGEDGHKICVAEVDNEVRAIGAGTVTMRTNLG